ncbi:MAG: trigger factor, partial [Chloroflexus sp.]|nr:trigger factor [Chloroflexus sp.]
QEQQYARYGITLEQVLQYRGITHDQAVDELLPEAERQTKVTLALSEVIKREGLTVSDDEIAAEIERILADYEEERRPQLKEMLNTQLRSSVANVVLDKKLRARLAEIARGELSATPAAEPATQSTATDEQSSRATDES